MRAFRLQYFMLVLLITITLNSCTNSAKEEKLSSPEEMLTGKWQVIMVQPVSLDTLNEEMKDIYFSEMEPLLVDSYILFGDSNRFSGDIAGDIRKGKWKANKKTIEVVSGNNQNEQWEYHFENKKLMIFTGSSHNRYKITLKHETK